MMNLSGSDVKVAALLLRMQLGYTDTPVSCVSGIARTRRITT